MDGAIKNHPEWGNRPRNTNTASSGLSLVWMLAGNLQTVCLDRRTQRSQGASKQPWGGHQGKEDRTQERECRNRGLMWWERKGGEKGQEGRGTEKTCENATENYYHRISLCWYVCMCMWNMYLTNIQENREHYSSRHRRLSNKKCTARIGSLSLSCQ